MTIITSAFFRLCQPLPGGGGGSQAEPVKLNLVDIVDIDTECRVPIVLEMEDLTLDGLVMGAGLESSSHRHGLIPSRRFVRVDYIPGAAEA